MVTREEVIRAAMNGKLDPARAIKLLEKEQKLHTLYGKLEYVNELCLARDRILKEYPNLALQTTVDKNICIQASLSLSNNQNEKNDNDKQLKEQKQLINIETSNQAATISEEQNQTINTENNNPVATALEEQNQTVNVITNNQAQMLIKEILILRKHKDLERNKKNKQEKLQNKSEKYNDEAQNKHSKKLVAELENITKATYKWRWSDQGIQNQDTFQTSIDKNLYFSAIYKSVTQSLSHLTSTDIRELLINIMKQVQLGNDLLTFAAWVLEHAKNKIKHEHITECIKSLMVTQHDLMQKDSQYIAQGINKIQKFIDKLLSIGHKLDTEDKAIITYYAIKIYQEQKSPLMFAIVEWNELNIPQLQAISNSIERYQDQAKLTQIVQAVNDRILAILIEEGAGELAKKSVEINMNFTTIIYELPVFKLVAKTGENVLQGVNNDINDDITHTDFETLVDASYSVF